MLRTTTATTPVQRATCLRPATEFHISAAAFNTDDSSTPFFLINPNPKAFTYQPRPTTGPTLHLHLGSSRRSLLRRWCTPTASGSTASVQTTVHTCALACAAGTAPTTRPLFNTRLMPTAKHKQTQRRRCKSTLSPMAGGRHRNALTTRAAKACQTVTTILLRALPSCKSGQHTVPTIRTTTLL